MTCQKASHNSGTTDDHPPTPSTMRVLTTKDVLPPLARAVTPTSSSNDVTAATQPQHLIGDDDGNSSSASSTHDPLLSSSFSFDDLSKFPRELARKVDWITQCHNPLEYLQTLGFRTPQKKQSFDMDDHVLDYDADNDQHYFQDDADHDAAAAMPFVAFSVPQHCEYCGSPSSKDCNPETCQRPSTFFPGQRPPFVSLGREWQDDTPSFSTTMTRQRLVQKNADHNSINSHGRRREDIRHLDPWKAAPTPKTKNQWISPARSTGKNCHAVHDSSGFDATGEGMLGDTYTAPRRLLFPQQNNDKDDKATTDRDTAPCSTSSDASGDLQPILVRRQEMEQQLAACTSSPSQELNVMH